MPAVNTSGWSYADWQEEATVSDRLSKLLQHITEVRQAVVEHDHGKGRSQRLNVSYLEQLEQQAKELRTVDSLNSAGKTNPTVTRPIV